VASDGDSNLPKKGYFHIGFVDPSIVNCKNLKSNPTEIFKNMYKYLSVQHYKSYILFLYNFADHWILVVIFPDQSLALVMDSVRRDPNQYKDISDMLNKVWKKFIRKHSGNFSAELKWKKNFSRMSMAI